MKKYFMYLCFFILFFGSFRLLIADVHAVTETSRLYMDYENKYPNELWLTEGKAYRKYGKRIYITRKDLGVMWYIDPGTKTYTEIKLEKEQDPAEEKEDIHMAGNFYNPEYDWELKETGEEKEINGFLCRCFFAEGDADYSEISSQYWICVQKTVPGGKEFREYMLEQVKNDPERPRLFDLMQKYETGFPVYREETVEKDIAPTIFYKMKLIKLEETDPPPGIYDLPEGYKKRER